MSGAFFELWMEGDGMFDIVWSAFIFSLEYSFQASASVSLGLDYCCTEFLNTTKKT